MQGSQESWDEERDEQYTYYDANGHVSCLFLLGSTWKVQDPIMAWFYIFGKSEGQHIE